MVLVPETESSDRDLAGRMLAGREDAFDEFFDSHFPRLYRFALARMNQDAGAAEEVAQAALCAAISRLKTYRGEATLFTWLCTFCRHEISAHYRRLGRTPLPVGLPEDSPEIRAALESLAATLDEGPETQLRRAELARLVQVTLDLLPRWYGDALEWKYIHDLSVKDIAARLKLGPKAAESLLTRARQAFREGFAALAGGHSGVESWAADPRGRVKS